MMKYNLFIILTLLCYLSISAQSKKQIVKEDNLQRLQISIDSLSSEFKKVELSTEIFSSQLSQQTTIFTVITSLAVLIIGLFNYWGLRISFELKLKLNQQNFEKLIKDQKSQFEIDKTNLIAEIQEIKNDIDRTDDLTNRHVYFMLRSEGPYELAILYGTKLVSRSITVKNESDAIMFLEYIIEDCQHLSNKESGKEYASAINKRLDKFSGHKNEKIKNMSDQIREKYNKHCWS